MLHCVRKTIIGDFSPIIVKTHCRFCKKTLVSGLGDLVSGLGDIVPQIIILRKNGYIMPV